MNTRQINSHPVLYTFRRCPYAIRARMALAYSDITIEMKEIFLQNRPQELFDISPKGTVPVLYLNNSKIIDESLDIMQWSLTQNDPDSWIIPNLGIQLKLIKENVCVSKKLSKKICGEIVIMGLPKNLSNFVAIPTP